MGVCRLQFDVWSPDDIQASAVCEVTSASLQLSQHRNALNDDRMGPLGRHDACRTCNGTTVTCPGHFGCIVLATPMYHVFFLPKVFRMLKRLCPSCNAVHKVGAKVCGECEHPLPKLTLKTHSIEVKYTYEQRASWPTELILVAPLTAAEAHRRLALLTDTQAAALGECAGRPDHLLLTVLPVCPPQARPNVVMKSGALAADDLTHKYAAIIKRNTILRTQLREHKPDHVIRDSTMELQWHLSTLFDGDLSTLKKTMNYVSKESCQGIRQRLDGKGGRMRKNLMGKRCDFTARTVITADPLLAIDQVGVPDSLALNLTLPVGVTHFNLAEMRQRIRLGGSHADGARYVTRKDGERFDLRFIASLDNVACKLQPGDTVERPLQDDDLVVS